MTCQSLVEHTTESWAVDTHRLHPKTNNPAGKLIHDDQDPMGFEQDRFGLEQVQTPQTVFRVSKERQPRRATIAAFRSVVGGQHSADHILIQGEAKGLGLVLGDLRTAKARIAQFEFTDGLLTSKN